MKAKAFIVMPFAPEYDAIHLAIKQACEKVGIDAVRADEIMQPGPIVNQVFDNISNADFVIAEVSSKNPNVYYEIALAHCAQKPSVLLARKNMIKELPFDIRHNRVISYAERNLKDLTEVLSNTLTYLKDTFLDRKLHPILSEYVEELSSKRGDSQTLLQEYIDRVAKEYGLTNARLVEQNYLDEDGFVVTIEDAFGEKVVFTVDANGMIRRKKRL